jgi:hypothetical protein
MGYGTRPHDWKLDELESMKTLSPSPSVWVRSLVVLRGPTHHRQPACAKQACRITPSSRRALRSEHVEPLCPSRRIY